MPIKIELRNKPPTRRKEKKAEKKKSGHKTSKCRSRRAVENENN